MTIASLSAAPAIVADRSDQIDQLAAALARVQSRLKPAARNAYNPFTKKHYADYSSLVEAAQAAGLGDEGLMVTQGFEQNDLRPELLTCVTLMVHGASGQWITNRITVLLGGKGSATPAQEVVAGSTYARRVGYGSITGVVADGEDQDGNARSGDSDEDADELGAEDVALAFLADKPRLRLAFMVDHPIIRDILAKLDRFGSISERQIKYVMDLAGEHGGESYRLALAAIDDDEPPPSTPKPKPSRAVARPGEPVVTDRGPLGPEPPPVGEPGPVESRSVQRRQAAMRDEPLPTFAPSDDQHWQPSVAQGQAMLRLLDECGFHHYKAESGERRVKLPGPLAEGLGLPDDFALLHVRDGVQWLALHSALIKQRDFVTGPRPAAAGGAQPLPAAAATSPGGAVSRPESPAASAAPGRGPKPKPANQQDVPF